MSNAYFFNTNYVPRCINRIRSELANQNWYTSPFGVKRSDLSPDLVKYFQDRLPFKITDAGFLSRDPISIYDPHIDPNRTFAINMLLTDPHPLANTYAMEHNPDYTAVRPLVVDYKKDCLLLLNTKQIHWIVNHSNEERVVLSIGCNSMTYFEMLPRLMNLINTI